MIDKKKLHKALCEMGTKHLKSLYKKLWTPENPTQGYCYVVAEVVFHCLAPEGSKVYRAPNPSGPDGLHYYIKVPGGERVDLTCDQFDKPVSYDKEKGCAFMTKTISKRGQVLADLLGYEY